MADFSKYFDRLLKLEGGYVNDPSDGGGPTNMGVTLAEWIRSGYDKNGDGKIDKEDVKLISKEDAYKIAKKNYWDAIRADEIKNQSIAEFIFDWGYNSGSSTAVKRVQEVLGIKQDGMVGSQTLQAINLSKQEDLFNKLKARRESFYRAIVRKNASQDKFLKGWLIRNNSFIFKP